MVNEVLLEGCIPDRIQQYGHLLAPFYLNAEGFHGHRRSPHGLHHRQIGAKVVGVHLPVGCFKVFEDVLRREISCSKDFATDGVKLVIEYAVGEALF